MKGIMLVFILVLLSGCNQRVEVGVTDEWVNQNINLSDCIVKDGNTLCKVENPCIVGIGEDVDITQRMLDECGGCINETCNIILVTPQYGGELI